MSAALAVRAAQLGRRTLVLTVDPAKRLATAMGIDLSGLEERVVPLNGGGEWAELRAAIIDSKAVFDSFIERYAGDPAIFGRLAKNRLYQQLSTTLSGSQEFTALERLLQAHRSGRYDLVILDTPPTQHAIDFLSAPDRIRSLFQDSITKWFMDPDAATGFWSGIIGRGTRAALKSLEVLTGAQFIEELIDFFASIRSIQKTLRDRTEEVQTLLKSNDSSFVLVTSFDVAKLMEAKHLAGHLDDFGYRLRACILNRAFPEDLPDLPAEATGGDPALAQKVVKLREFHARVKADHAVRFQAFQQFEREMPASISLKRVPEYRQDIFGLEDLVQLANFLGE